jgi:hypothetical protein
MFALDVPTPVPEPSTIVLVGGGITAVILWKRSKNAR